ncbi:unnamed protein product [Cercospora beticola]|nr:unnamed protein product [Cercospora beticola]
MAATSLEAEMQRLIEHIFLPPKLPHSEDEGSDIALISITRKALASLQHLILPNAVPPALTNAIALMDRLKKINSLELGKTNESALRSLLSLPAGQTLAFKVSAQNTGVMISRQAKALVFEAFELSAANAAVMGTKGRLTRTFPGVAVSLSAETLAQDDCAATIAATLSRMCHQSVPGMQPVSWKAGFSHEEGRDTASPAAVTELFFGFVKGLESTSAITVSQITKNTRDEVLWNQAKGPWRRASMWLLIRVALQLVISRSPGGSRDFYKEVMVYIMSFTLQTSRDPPSELLFAMSAKISRRLHKLYGTSLTLPGSVRADIDRVLRETSDKLSARWDTIQKRDQRNLQLPALVSLNFEADTQVALPELDQYLAALHARQRNTASSCFAPSSELLHHTPDALPLLPSQNSGNLYYATANLHQFEQWVSQHLGRWLTEYAGDDACGKLHRSMEAYHSLADSHYSGNPEMQSVMVLTIYDIWVACDQIAVNSCSLLAEYDPEIPIAVLETLLLPSRSQMERLVKVEQYLQSRKRNAVRNADQLFSMGSQGFANRYFDQSDAHQDLLAEIQKDAKEARERKIQQYRTVKAEYHHLDSLHHQAQCEHATRVIDAWCVPPETERYHKPDCNKCSLARQRDALSIEVHEWPLPDDPSRARAVVFELRVPVWLGHWRDARTHFLRNVLKGRRPQLWPHTSYMLSSNDPHLTHLQGPSTHRITLLSQTKPCVNTRWSSKAIATLREAEVCQPNGLQYEYHDSVNSEITHPFTFDDAIARACTYELSRDSLQRFIFRPTAAPDGVAPNAVIAGQDTCPQDMPLDEYKELTTIALGRHIQWANIMLQLAMPGIDFKKTDTTLCLLQCINQAGPPRGIAFARESHVFPSISANADALAANLIVALQRVKENWESAQALRTFISIAARLLSLSSSVSSRDNCLEVLRSAREIAVKWVGVLREKAYVAQAEADRTIFVSKAVEMALICASAFDVEDEYIDDILQHDGSILLQCSIVIQEGEHSRTSDGRDHVSLLDVRYKRLLHRLYKTLAQQHLHNQLDHAVDKMWSGYRPGNHGWHPVSTTVDHWLETETATTPLAPSMSVHFDLLSGTLLVNGLPLNSPPRSYRECQLYSTLFRNAAVEVMPCVAPGFDFSTKRSFGNGYAVQLGLNAGDLLVKAQKGNATFEAIPARVISGFPMHFQHDYVHWFDTTKNVIQFRPKNDPWSTSSSAMWTLFALPGQTRWQLQRAGSCVAGLSSQTSQHVANILEPLAESAYIHNILHVSGGEQRLHVDIPTLRTGFLLSPRSSDLESREYRSMIIDSDQSMGTLVGLKSRIVLKPQEADDHHPGSRMALLPESGSILYNREGGHVSVAVVKRLISKVHAVSIDAELGRLIHNADNGLYLAYLHALTSFCLIDPLTKKSGTEQALNLMRSAAVHSLDRLSQGDIQALQLLAKLSPGRSFYPKHLQSMQVVYWDHNLSFLSQHGHFVQHAQDLLQRACRAAEFFPKAQAELQEVTLRLPDQHLSERDNIRSATFRVSTFGAEDHTATCDVEYQARDRDVQSQRAMDAANMASFMSRHGNDRSLPAVSAGQLWQVSLSASQIEGPGSLTQPHELTTFSPGLLLDGHEQVIKYFPVLHRWASSAGSRAHKFSILMWLSTIASQSKLDASILQLLAMTFKSPSLAQMGNPDLAAFSPGRGVTSDFSTLRQIVFSFRKPLGSCPENHLARKDNEKLNAYNSRRSNTWQQKSENVIRAFASALTGQWPCEVPTTPAVSLQAAYINVGDAMRAIKEQFKSWHDNKRLRDYFAQLELTMGSFGYQELPSLVTARNVHSAPDVDVRSGFVSEQELFSVVPPDLPQNYLRLEVPAARQDVSSRRGESRLASLLKTLKECHSQSRFAKKYAEELDESLDALQSSDGARTSIEMPEAQLVTNLTLCAAHAGHIYHRLEAAVQAAMRSLPKMHTPRISPLGFLQQLARSRWSRLTPGWQASIVEYGLALTALQRAVRLLKLSNPSRMDDLVAELRNIGHTNWDPMQYPESLLIEVESGIMIREVQEQIAGYMRDPPGGENAVMQLLMGQGKSSVIVPIVSAFLAGTGDRLCRVLVAKPQSKQMAQMLISKLGGLVDRRLYYMPFSRSLKLDAASAATICDLLRECMLNGGILLVQPEHILSFQLMALECFIAGKQDVGRQLLAADIRSMLSSARDIIDEADENFSVNFELIYTMGLQSAIEASPDRWILVQQILGVVKLLGPRISKAAPDAVEYLPGAFAGSFPRIRILREEGGNLLLDSLADHVCAHGLRGLQISRQPETIRKAIRQYITKLELSAEDVKAVEESVFWTDANSSPLLLLRGFIAGGVLAFVFGHKRWRVNYGLTTAPRVPPTKLAVPYRAKDMPSPRSEFSHPDVVLFLTSLSYYYGGLGDEDLFTALSHVLDSDQADIEYMAWVKDAPTLPIAFRQLQGINLKDRSQCINEVFPSLRFAKNVVDYFLSNVIFTKEAKQFPESISHSGWNMGRSKKDSGGFSVAFSGTNDSKDLLPTDVAHLDLQEQKHTNALVLEHILQPGNGVVLMQPAMDMALSDAERLLTLAMALDPPVQVILDVGAQILEMDNLQVAKTWLEMHDTEKEAAIFVNDDDELCVVDREGRVELLRTSSYATRLGSCLVFLDEAHTRGIDLKLPATYRALLTLGAGLTKDRTTQAAMRIRRLGQGQMIVFCIPQEIQSKICELTSKSDPGSISTSDVLLWTISETHKEIRRCIPLWKAQGERFCRQEMLWAEYEQSKVMSKDLAERFQEDDAQSIEQRYRPRQQQPLTTHLRDCSDGRLRLIAQRCEEHDDLNLNASTLQEEQERELSPEIEQERQVQRPHAAEPAKHTLHNDVIAFAKQGTYSSNSRAYMPAFQAFRHTSAVKAFDLAQLKKDPKLHVSLDFVETVQRSGIRSYKSDSFQRSVNWLLSTKTPEGNDIERILIISPYEANQLYPSMAQSKATLHLYKSRGNSGYEPLDRLDFHTVPILSQLRIPRSLAIQLNLFAGQLYISSYEDYLEICKFLGLSTRAVTEDMLGWQQDATGFILRDDQGRLGGESGLKKSPVNFMKILMSKIRKNGQSIAKTHMGELLDGKLFQQSDFE